MGQTWTDALQHDRLTVVAVDKGGGRVRLKGPADACSDLACGGQTRVVADDTAAEGLDTLNPGDIVRLEHEPGGAARIIVVRRVWDELTSPEF